MPADRDDRGIAVCLPAGTEALFSAVRAGGAEQRRKNIFASREHSSWSINRPTFTPHRPRAQAHCLSTGRLSASLPVISLPLYRQRECLNSLCLHTATPDTSQGKSSREKERCSGRIQCVPVERQPPHRHTHCLSASSYSASLPPVSLPLCRLCQCLSAGIYNSDYESALWTSNLNFTSLFNTFPSLPLCRHTALNFPCGLPNSSIQRKTGWSSRADAQRRTGGETIRCWSKGAVM